MSSSPFVRRAQWPELRPGGVVEALRRDDPEGCVCALLGLPDDLGVRLNRGRPGAARGPSAFRAALARLGSTWDARRREALSLPFFDAGDVVPASGDGEEALFETHRRVEEAAASLHRAGLVVLAVGGGHDLSLPTLRAWSRHAGQALGGVNFDAHLDVRCRVGSGMPFRWLIDGGFVEAVRFAEVGLGRFSNGREDFRWLEARGAKLVLADEVLGGAADPRALLRDVCASGPAFVTIDLDGLDQSAAPGVSAPSPMGLGVSHAVALAEEAGQSPAVRHFDLMELCPDLDEGERTARVAAFLAVSFLAGLAERLERAS